mmetsp:Transcript_11711/g.28149  ORF Transcript_11711/g.28149 Transcript_11711/m.28149 type:complete len:101 (+) Transcript_11711:1175-1477(+)
MELEIILADRKRNMESVKNCSPTWAEARSGSAGDGNLSNVPKHTTKILEVVQEADPQRNLLQRRPNSTANSSVLQCHVARPWFALLISKERAVVLFCRHK